MFPSPRTPQRPPTLAYTLTFYRRCKMWGVDPFGDLASICTRYVYIAPTIAVNSVGNGSSEEASSTICTTCAQCMRSEGGEYGTVFITL